MTTAHPSPLVEGPYATYDLPMTSVLWVVAMVNSRPHQQTHRQGNGIWNGSQHREEEGHYEQHEHQCRC